jgi:hypothetical protein
MVLTLAEWTALKKAQCSVFGLGVEKALLLVADLA